MTSKRGVHDSHLIAERLTLDEGTVHEVIRLLDEDNTVPFIARYRKKQTKGLDPTVLRQIEALHHQYREVKVKVENTKKKIGESLTNDIIIQLDNAQSSEEVDDIYAPFKKGGKKTLAARAKELGLEPLADIALQKSTHQLDFTKYLSPQQEGLKTIKQVKLGVQHIIADIIAKDSKSVDKLRELVDRWPPELESSLSSKAAKDDKLSKERMKYKNYHNFSRNVNYLKSHQILAINRAEGLKILTVKIALNPQVKNQFLAFAKSHWMSLQGRNHELLKDSIGDAFDRLLSPAICRRTRSSLKKKAELESTKVFTQNLYSLLLTTPVKGKSVLALDPGYTNGCKMALLSATGLVLETALIFPTGRKANIGEAKTKITSLLHRHSCETIAIGNGVACRETEMFIAKMIADKTFLPLEVVYCIVSEDGASVYSASKEAIAELPHLDLSMRGAVSIGRRLQDPLLELVKIEPKHLGIGMYQHDIPENMLRNALGGVFTDCVSLVGVDINAAGVSTLKHIAGLNEKKAKNVLEWRERNKRFINRSQLAQVKGIGKKSYEQCIGFLKVLPENKDVEEQKSQITQIIVSDDDDDYDVSACTGSKRKKSQKQSNCKRSRSTVNRSSSYNYLDGTLIHPESYELAERVMKKLSVRGKDIGTRNMTTAIGGLLASQNLHVLADEYGVDVSTIELIIEGLKKPTDYDIRTSFEKPIFKKGLTMFEDLYPGKALSGRVTNVTTFGAFVDCGVGRDGLIHESQFNRHDEPLTAGDVVEVIVYNVDKQKEHFQLKVVSVRPRLKAHLLTS